MVVPAIVYRICVVLLLSSLYACGSTSATWIKEGATAEETARDRLECERKARSDVEFQYPQATYGSATGGSGTTAMVAELQRFNLCMKSKGYTESTGK